MAFAPSLERLTISDLFLAYRQAKNALYFERRGIGLLSLAKFESELPARLRSLHSQLLTDQDWFDSIAIGKLLLVPKHLAIRPREVDEISRIGTPRDQRIGSDPDLEVHLLLVPSPEFAILEILYLWHFGPALDSQLSANVLGYRLDLRQDLLAPTRRWIFKHWPSQYQAFRLAPLQIARSQLQHGDEVVVVSADLETFYDTVDASFLVHDSFLARLLTQNQLFDAEAYLAATHSLLRSYRRYQGEARRILGTKFLTGIPIGALSSRVVANVSLSSLDEAIATRDSVLVYRRYVDDMVIVGCPTSNRSFERVLSEYLPHLKIQGETIKLDCRSLGRSGSDFRLRRRKTKIHHLGGPQGVNFISSIMNDFRHLASERRALLDLDALIDGTLNKVVTVKSRDGGALRVLRDADRTRLEHLSLATTLRSFERACVLLDPGEVKGLTSRVFEALLDYFAGEEDWVNNLDLEYRLLSLILLSKDWTHFDRLMDRMAAGWGSLQQLQGQVGRLKHRQQMVTGSRSWTALRDYLQGRQVEAIAAALPIPGGVTHRHYLRDGVRTGPRTLGSLALVNRAKLLRAADLRILDREAERSPPTEALVLKEFAEVESALKNRFKIIETFRARCKELSDHVWDIDPAALFLSTRPPTYFDIARRWLAEIDLVRKPAKRSNGGELDMFAQLLEVVNAVRGTEYRDPVGSVVDESTVAIPPFSLPSQSFPSSSVRLILGNLRVSDKAFEGAAQGAPVHSLQRLTSLVAVLDRARRVALTPSPCPPSLLILPELSVPRKWFRMLANHVVELSEFGMVVGLEYHRHPSSARVTNQAFAVLPGPFSSVATWPWTKLLPAREEEKVLGELDPPVMFSRRRAATNKRTVVLSNYGRFSVLICSELIECRRISDLLGRVDLVIAPSWNKDTVSYEHLIHSVGLQLHAFIAIANNGRFSDCRIWGPRGTRWRRDCCRLIQRAADDVIAVDVPLTELRFFRTAGGNSRQRASTEDIKSHDDWLPLPPDWPDW